LDLTPEAQPAAAAAFPDAGRGSDIVRERVADEIAALTVEGAKLIMALTKDGDETSFKLEYLVWYNTASAAIRQIAPDLAPAFVELYQPRGTALTLATWGVHHYLLGLTFGAMDPKGSALARVIQQLAIVKSLERRLDSVASNLRSALQADLFDTELDAASELLKNGHVRAAGSVAGVVIERHLGVVATAHSATVAKRNPTIADLNDRLREENVYPQTTWRRVQYMADIRNLCAHQKEREPTPDEVGELLKAADWLIKNIA
jgi:hypothetical protein